MVFSCCCLRIVYCLFFACVCICESSGYVLLAQWRIIIALSSGTAKGTQCNASQDHNSQRTHTYADVMHLPLHALPSRSRYGHPVFQYLLHNMMRQLHISRLSIPPCRLGCLLTAALLSGSLASVLVSV